MEVIDVILSAPVLFGLVVASCLVLVTRAVINALGQLPSLRVQLENVDRQLSTAHQGIPQKRAELSQLQELLKPLKQTAQHLQDYNTALIDVERQAMREEEDKRRSEEIPVHRPGPPREI